VQFADILGKRQQLFFCQFVSPICPEERWQRLREQFVLGKVARQLVPSDRSRIEELLLLLPNESKKTCEFLKEANIIRGWVDAALDLAPVAWINAELLAEFAQLQAFCDAELFGEFRKHSGVTG